MRLGYRAVLGAALAMVALPVLAQGFSEGFTFLKAVRERDGTTMQGIISNPSSTAINARDRATGEGALHILVESRELPWLAFLLSKGARPDIQRKDGATPLALSALLGWVEGAEQLLTRGASVDLANDRGETPLMLAVQRRNLPMVRLLLSHGANPNLTDNAAGLSAIDHARRDSRSAPILRLLEDPPEVRTRRRMGPGR